MKTNRENNLSHELLTPINAIIGISSQLFEEKGFKELEIIKEKGELLLKNINKLLGISSKESFNIDELIYDIYTPFENLVKLKYQRRTEQVFCYADKDGLKDIVEEIIVSYVNCVRQLELSVHKENDCICITFNNHPNISLSNSEDFQIIQNESCTIIKFLYNKKNVESFNGKVLLVEDDEINQIISKKFFESLGFFVDLASDGIEALDFINQNPYKYNCIIMDCQMPNMDGYECTTEIRKFNKKIPIIALTANTYKENKEKCLNSGINDFLIKPIRENEAIASLKKFLPMSLNNTNNESLNYFKDNCGDGGAFLESLLKKFLTNLMTKDLPLIEVSLKTNDYEILRQIFHRLKSTFGTFGLDKTTDLLNNYQKQEFFSNDDYFLFRSHLKADLISVRKWCKENNLYNWEDLFNKI